MLVVHAAAVAVLVALDRSPGVEVAWGAGGVLALAGAVAVRNPVLATASGTYVSIGGGILLGTLWLYGWPTALFTLVLSQSALWLSGVIIYHDYWVAGVMAAGAMLVTAGAATLLGHGQAQTGAIWVVTAVVYWLVGRTVEAAWRARENDRPLWPELGNLLAGTWWAVPLYLTGALMLVAAAAMPYLDVFVALALALVQRVASTVVNGLFQDRAVSELLRRAGRQRTGRHAHYERLLRHTQGIGRALRLPEAELRLLTYAGLLQDIGAAPVPPPEAELAAAPPSPAVRAALGRYANSAADLIRRIAPLRDVSRLVQHRYAWWDGSGEPAAAGAALPMGAQVLAAANALTLMAANTEQALLWLRAQSGRRLAPEVARAAEAALREEAAAAQDSPRLLPEALRRLQAIGGPGAPRLRLPSSLARFLHLRRRLSGTLGLPEEVMAVAQLSQVLNSSTTLDGALDVVMAAVSALTGGAVFAALTTESGEAMVVRGARGFKRMQPVGMQLELLGGPITRAMARQEPVALYSLADEVPGPAAAAFANEEGVRSALALPLVARGRSLGLLFVALDDHYWFTRREIGLLSLIAAQAALAVDNSRLLAQAEERLQRVTSYQRLLDLLIDNLPAGVMLVDTEDKVPVINKISKDLLDRAGYPVPEPGGTFQRRLDWREGPINRILAGEDNITMIWEPAPDLVLQLRSRAVKDEEGRLLGALMIAWDISQVRQMEGQVHRVERLAAMGKLAAGAAHEIRNPLAAIRGFQQLLQTRQAPGSAEAEYSHIILSEIDRIENIVRDLLLLGRPSEPVRAPLCLATLLDDVLVLAAEDLRTHGVALVREYYREAGDALGDAKLLKQVALNLVRNAVEAMPSGGQLTLAAGAAGGRAWFRVQDTGVGIPPADLHRLFTPFFTTKETGTGLGLAICYAIVEAHQGRIEVHSQPGAGTAVTVWLPPAPAAGGGAPHDG